MGHNYLVNYEHWYYMITCLINDSGNAVYCFKCRVTNCWQRHKAVSIGMIFF